MDTETVSHFRQKLSDERGAVERELKNLGVMNDAGEWEATGATLEVMSPVADSNEFADQLEEYQERRAEVDALQARWNEIKRALQKTEDGTYGVCEVGGEEIERDRLEANPSARTCKAHMDEEKNLGA